MKERLVDQTTEGQQRFDRQRRVIDRDPEAVVRALAE